MAATKYPQTAKKVSAANYAERNTVFDTKVIDSTTSSVSFFDPNASGSKYLSNYEENPLPGSYRRLVNELGFELNTRAITFDTAADAEAFLNNIENAYVEIWKGDQRCNYQRITLPDLFDVDTTVAPVRTAGADAGDKVLVTFKPQSVAQLVEPIVLEPNERLYVELYFPANDGLPAADSTVGTPGGDLAVRCKLGISRWTQAQQNAAQNTSRPNAQAVTLGR